MLAIEFLLTPERMEIRREVYGFLDLIADVGGVKEVLISICGVLMYSIGRQSYNLKFMKDLFLVR